MTAPATLKVRRTKRALTVVARETAQFRSGFAMLGYGWLCHIRARGRAFDFVAVAAGLHPSHRVRRVAEIDSIRPESGRRGTGAAQLMTDPTRRDIFSLCAVRLKAVAAETCRVCRNAGE